MIKKITEITILPPRMGSEIVEMERKTTLTVFGLAVYLASEKRESKGR